ncbi:MAG: hypothetical protein JKX97_02065 [Candidatus Lindowbacteria bacterium]|nr:hypothetical protein [Candidatus Lindowbacteria bacterium]
MYKYNLNTDLVILPDVVRREVECLQEGSERLLEGREMEHKNVSYFSKAPLGAVYLCDECENIHVAYDAISIALKPAAFQRILRQCVEKGSELCSTDGHLCLKTMHALVRIPRNSLAAFTRSGEKLMKKYVWSKDELPNVMVANRALCH